MSWISSKTILIMQIYKCLPISTVFRVKQISFSARRMLSVNLNHNDHGLLEEDPINISLSPDIASQSSNNKIRPIKPKKVKALYNLQHRKAIVEHLESKPHLLELKPKVPNYLFRKVKAAGYFYIIDTNIADVVFETIKPYLKSTKSHVMEFNAGFGVLTSYLVKNKIPRLRVYEPDPTLASDLVSMITKQQSDAQVFKTNMVYLNILVRLDREDNEDRVGKMLKGLPTLSWEDEPVVKIIGAIGLTGFVAHIMYSIINQSWICSYGRPEMFFIMPLKTLKLLTAKPEDGASKYLAKSVLFHLFFEHKILNTFPDTAFLPWMGKPKNSEVDEEMQDKMCLVHITARQDLFHKVPADLLKPLWFFVKSLMQRRKEKLIIVMEKWIPGCGVRLISRGYTIYTECGSLQPEELLQLFLEFTSWPGYSASSFHTLMESLLERMSDPGLAEMTDLYSIKQKKEGNAETEHDRNETKNDLDITEEDELMEDEKVLN